jgi:hypothetical protein
MNYYHDKHYKYKTNPRPTDDIEQLKIYFNNYDKYTEEIQISCLYAVNNGWGDVAEFIITQKEFVILDPKIISSPLEHKLFYIFELLLEHSKIVDNFHLFLSIINIVITNNNQLLIKTIEYLDSKQCHFYNKHYIIGNLIDEIIKIKIDKNDCFFTLLQLKNFDLNFLDEISKDIEHVDNYFYSLIEKDITTFSFFNIKTVMQYMQNNIYKLNYSAIENKRELFLFSLFNNKTINNYIEKDLPEYYSPISDYIIKNKIKNNIKYF